MQNVKLVEDNSTHLTLTWEEPFHSQDVISLYYIVILVNLDAMDKRHENTTSTSIYLGITNCGLHELNITAYGSREGNNFPYEAVAVTRGHNVTFDGGETSFVVSVMQTTFDYLFCHFWVVYQLSLLEDSIEVEYQGSAICNVNLTILVRSDSVVLYFTIHFTIYKDTSTVYRSTTMKVN